MNIEQKRITRALIIVVILFISIIIYMSYFEVFKAEQVRNNNYNKRLWINEEFVLRGSILDRNNRILAYSEIENGNQIRHYEYGPLYSHVIGYSYREYGKAGIESSYNSELLNLEEHDSIKKLKKIITNNDQKGNNVVLTIDHELQDKASQLLKEKKGSIVVMNPTNGEIYAMVSNPTFNPSTLKEEWARIIEDDNSPLLNRATTGVYTPGSVFKVITLASALEDIDAETIFECDGSINIDGYVLGNSQGIAHGNIDITEALVKSCNVAFSKLGLQIGQEKLTKTAEKFMLNSTIPLELKTKNSIFPSNHKMDNPEIAASSIGQGKILVTPLNMVLVASAIANNGEVVKPTLVKEIVSPSGRIISNNEPEVLSRAISVGIADEIKEMMVQVVENGTGKRAKINNVKIAGKTGTAENDTGKTHAWFIGFAPADDPQIAVSIVLESAGTSGGEGAAPLAKELIYTSLKLIQ